MVRKNYLREVRASIGTTQEHLAEALGISQAQVQRHESNKNEMTISQLYAYAEALDCHVMDILEGPSCK